MLTKLFEMLIIRRKLLFRSGATIVTTDSAGTESTIDLAEFGVLDVTAGTATASKAAVLGANKNIDTLVIADGGLYLGATAGTSVTATAAELNYNDIATLGTGAPSKAVVLGAAGGFTNTMTAPTTSVDGFTFGFTSGSATPGSCRAMVGSATGFTSMTSGNIVGMRGIATLGGAHSSAAYAYGVQGKLVTGAHTVTGKTTAAVYAQFDVTGGVMTSGDSAGVVSLITGATALGGDGSGQFPGLDGIYVESVGGGNIHSVLRFLGGAEYAFDLTDGGVADFILAAGSGGTSSAGYAAGAGVPTKVLKCWIDGAAMYIPCYSSNA